VACAADRDSFEAALELRSAPVVRVQSRTVGAQLATRLDRALRLGGWVYGWSFNDVSRNAADAGLLSDPATWRIGRELRNATSHAYHKRGISRFVRV